MNATAVDKLKKLAGESNVRIGVGSLARYFRDPVSECSLVLVTPERVDQLADIASLAFENDIPMYSVRRRYVEDSSLAAREGILIDLAGMNEIKKIDTRNLTAHVYGGVTFDQLQRELDKVNQRILFPVAGQSPHVLRSYFDRDILMGSGGYRHPHLSVFHAVMADGELWISGSQQLTDEGHADFREDQGPQFSPFFGASEDIFGIPYYGLVYTYPNRETRKLVAFGFKELEGARNLVYRASRAEWCFEAFAADDRYLSVLLAGGDARNVTAVMKKLNPWTAVFSIEHHRELVELWDGYIKSAARELGGTPLRGSIPDQLEGALKKPWQIYDRDYFRGRCRHVFCYQHFKNVPETFGIIEECAVRQGLKPGQIGRIVVPSYFGGAAYCEADLYYDHRDDDQRRAADATYRKAFEALLDARAFVDKPAGELAGIVYSRVEPSTIEILKTFKRTVDPKGLMNPDQLLEGV